MKKFLSLVLALTMMMSLVTINAGAKEFTDDEELNYKEAVDVISEISVVDGYEDGSFKPQNTLTRGAAAKIICNLILGPTTAAELHADTAPYKDVPVSNTFSGYIAYCAKEKIISGYADGSFRPAGTLTGYAFMKMLLGALGYDATYEGYTGGNWSINVAKQAIGIGLNKGLVDEFNGVDFVTREEAALYAFNTLKATMVDYDQKITTNVNGVDVTISQGNAKPVDWSEGRNEDGNIKDDGFVQFAEEYFPDLVRKDDTTEFEAPANTWVNKKTEIGTYERTDLIVEKYTTGVTGRDIYDLLKSGVIDDNDLVSYVDAKDNTIKETDLVRSNNNDLTGTGDGVETTVYLDTDLEKISIISINTYLGKATADYSESKEYAPITVYVSDANGKNFNVDIEDVDSVVDVKKDSFYQIRISYKDNTTNGDVVLMAPAEVLEDATVTKFSADDGNNKNDTNKVTKLTTGGEEYKANVKAFYDDDVLSLYDDSRLTDNTYTVYLDTNGYFIGVELFEGSKNYVFIPGYDLDGSHIAMSTATASAIFLDGTMKTIKVNVKDTNKNIDKVTGDNAADFKHWAGGDDQLNQWYTYTVDADGEYTLKPCGRSVERLWNAGTDPVPTIRTDNLSVQGNGANNDERVYGEDATVFLTVDTDDVSESVTGAFKGITEVTGVYTGVQNVDIEIDVDASSPAVQMGQFFAVYDSDYYVIGAVVLGEARGATANYAYILSQAKSEELRDGTYYWTFEAVLNGEVQTLTAKSKYSNTINDLVKNTVQELRFDGDYVVSVKDVKDKDIYGNQAAYHNGGDVAKELDGEDVYQMLGLTPGTVPGTYTLKLQGRTLYTTSDRTDMGLAMATDAKAVTIQTENGKTNVKTEFTDVSSAIAHLADPDNDTSNGTQYDGNIFAILDSNGTAKWVVFVSNTPLNTGNNGGTTPTVNGLGIAVDTNSLQVVAKFREGTPSAAERQQIVLAMRDAGVNVSYIDSALAYAIDTSGNYYSIYLTEYYEVTVDGTVVDRVATVGNNANVNYTASGAGTGYLDNSSSYQAYSTPVLVKGSTSVTSHMTIATGYIKTIAQNSITKGSDSQINSQVPSTVTSSNNTDTFVKVSDGLKVDVTYAQDTGVSGDHYVWVEYTTADGMTATSKQTVTEAALKAGAVNLSFSLGTLSKDITAIAVKAQEIPATMTLTAPVIKDSGSTVVTGLNGLSVSAVANKVSGTVGEQVIVTVTISGKPSAATKLTLSGTADGAWDSTRPADTSVSGDDLTVAATANYVTPVQVKFAYTINSTTSNNAPVITLANG